MKSHIIYFLIFFVTFLLSLAPPTTAYSGDTQPPHIELQDLSDNNRVYTDKIYIAGQVTDEHDIETLKLNNTSLIRSPGRSIFFSHLVKLSEGENIITIEATDEAGNSAKKNIAVVRETLSPSQLPPSVMKHRMRIAVYPFEQKGVVSEESGLFMDLIMMAFQKQKRFQLTDRALMDRILEEQKLSITQFIDQDTALKMGRIMSAQAIITGRIVETETGTEMVGRMIDTETSKIMATEKIYTASRGLEALTFLAESMAVQFHNDFPMLRGVVIKRKDRYIFTDLGRKTLPLRGRLILYRENDPETDNTVLGYARIIQVLPGMSKAELISGRIDEIRELDRVVLQ